MLHQMSYNFNDGTSISISIDPEKKEQSQALVDCFERVCSLIADAETEDAVSEIIGFLGIAVEESYDFLQQLHVQGAGINEADIQEIEKILAAAEEEESSS